MITTVVINEVHNGSAHSDYVLAITLAVMQKTPDLRLVLMSATGDHNLVRERIPYCQQLVMKGGSSARLPFLCPPHRMVQTHTKEKMFLHGILDTKGVSRMGHATACMDLPREWAQFMYVCAERGLEDSALILIATWYREGLL